MTYYSRHYRVFAGDRDCSIEIIADIPRSADFNVYCVTTGHIYLKTNRPKSEVASALAWPEEDIAEIDIEAKPHAPCKEED